MLLRAVSLGFGGYVDLDLKFGEFFNANHTLVVRYLPQYPYAYAGPLLAENGPGRFMIGQGDYRWGTGDFKQVGPSTLFLEVGDERAVYEVPHTAGDDPNGPRLYRDTWQVLAAVREGDTYSLYLNGRRLHPFQDPNVPDPATDVVVGPNRAPQDHAKLRVGRRSRGRGNSNRGYQFYGLVDDVAVYGRAFNRTEVGAIWDAPALTGDEADLIAAWSFDEPEAGDPVPPSTLARPFHVPDEAEIPDHVNPNAAQQLPVYLVPVSPDRDSAVDALQLDTRPSKTHMEVPFGVGEIWRVGQPWHSPGGSHNGFAAFAWDLNRVGEATFDQPIHAAGTGRIRESIQNDDDGGAPAATENKLRIVQAPDEIASYLHLRPGWFTKYFPGEPVQPPTLPEGQQPEVESGQIVADVSDHLHFGTRLVEPFTIPVALQNYEMSENNGADWERVLVGIPVTGQWLRRADPGTPLPPGQPNDPWWIRYLYRLALRIIRWLGSIVRALFRR